MKQCLSPGPDLDLFSPHYTSAQDGIAHPLAAMNSSWLPLTQTFPGGSGKELANFPGEGWREDILNFVGHTVTHTLLNSALRGLRQSRTTCKL